MAIAKIVALSLALNWCAASAADTVTLYDSPGFNGQAFTINVSPWSCINVGSSFNDRASSARWNVPSGKGASVFFYQHNDCQGEVRYWQISENNYPNNFAVDGIDNMVSSVKMTGGWEDVNEIESVGSNATTTTSN